MWDGSSVTQTRDWMQGNLHKHKLKEDCLQNLSKHKTSGMTNYKQDPLPPGTLFSLKYAMVCFSDLICVFSDIATSNGLFFFSEKPLMYKLKDIYPFLHMFSASMQSQSSLFSLSFLSIFPTQFFVTINPFSLRTPHFHHQPPIAF